MRPVGSFTVPRERYATRRCWRAMVSRCTNRADQNYTRYGGRGITVCERWLVFENFLADMGDRPQGLSIERINNERGYSPENCCWASRAAQVLNTRRTVRLTYNGITKTASQWADDLGINRSTLYKRLNRSGWSVTEALTV